MGGWRLGLAGLVAGSAAAWLISCAAGDAFSCESHAQCGEGGTCEASGYCSFADSRCPSGQVYGEHAPGGIAGECVPVTELGTETQTDPVGDDGQTTGTSGVGSTSGPPDPDSGGGETLALTSGASSDGGEDSTSDGAVEDSSSGDSTGTPVQRVADGLLVLYRFDAGSGDSVQDLADDGAPIPLTLQYEQGSPVWQADGLNFEGGGVALAEGSSSKVRLGLQATNEMTLEAWVTPTELVQTGPPRLITLSMSSSLRSFSLLHGGGTSPPGDDLPFGDEYGVRLQTSLEAEPNGLPTFVSEPLAEPQLTQVVATREDTGMLTVWVDGAAVASEVREGDFSPWPEDHVLAIGNEVTLGRPYIGTIHLAAIYDRALSATEVQQNFDAGI